MCIRDRSGSSASTGPGRSRRGSRSARSRSPRRGALSYRSTGSRYFTYYPYYDKIAPLVSGISIALIGFLGVIFLDRYWRMNLTPLFIVFFTLTFGMALGGIWEIYEFAVDQVFGGSLAGPMQLGLADTMWDMIADLLGSVGVSLVGIVYFRYHRVEEIED